MIGSQNLHILIDTGSTHNFMDATTAKRLRCELLRVPPLVVAVADGAKLPCQVICRGLQLRLGGLVHEIDAYIIPLGNWDMIMGVQWLATLGSILWDFKNLTMEFKYRGRRQLLEGLRTEKLSWADEGRHRLLSQAVQLFAVHISVVQPEVDTLQGEIEEPKMSQLLQEFADIFEEPQALPPHRTHDHRIVLKEGVSLVNVRSYRYPTLQKDIIEKIIKEMLEAGVIRPSQSPYSSPIVLVKKKDGSWRLCVDYRQLNKHTVLDKFPIPVVEELLDELHGARNGRGAGTGRVELYPHPYPFSKIIPIPTPTPIGFTKPIPIPNPSGISGISGFIRVLIYDKKQYPSGTKLA